jgi:hypothetical protein
MEPAERIESRTALGKRQRSRALPRTASMVTVPSAAKQGRQEGAADVPSSTSLPDASVGMGAAGGGAPQRGYSSGSYLAGAQTAAFLMACGLCSRSLGPGRDTYIYRFEIDITDDFFFKKNFSRFFSGMAVRISFVLAPRFCRRCCFYHVRVAHIGWVFLFHVRIAPRSNLLSIPLWFPYVRFRFVSRRCETLIVLLILASVNLFV